MDPIADMLTQIRNAQAVRKSTVDIPFSKLKFEIIKILEKEGFIENISKKGRGVRKKISLSLKFKNKTPLIGGLKRISKPGRKIYVSKNKIPQPKESLGISIISTSQGLMANKEARKKGLGGEVICEIY